MKKKTAGSKKSQFAISLRRWRGFASARRRLISGVVVVIIFVQMDTTLLLRSNRMMSTCGRSTSSCHPATNLAFFHLCLDGIHHFLHRHHRIGDFTLEEFFPVRLADLELR